MEIKEKITLDMLTQNSVSVLRQNFIELNGVETQVGGNVRNAYENDETGRTARTELTVKTARMVLTA